ncbi:MAG TPA: fibronectin type III domain-containing protein [Vicinamibacterales bacterium]|nr:fibronectin type III domain-containing protein [Vicinamibacterales bacterium]
MNITNKARLRIAAACVLGMAAAGAALAGGVEKGIVDLTTNYGASGAIASVTGVCGINGAADSVEVKFAGAMHPGNFGMGVNFAKSWTKTWNADNTVLTIGGDIDLADAARPALIVYLMQTAADRRDISEPNIFKFQDIKVTAIDVGNDQVNVEYDHAGPTGKGYGVYIAKSENSPFKQWGQVNYHSKGVHIKGLKNGETYRFYLEYVDAQRNGLVSTRTTPVTFTLPAHPGNSPVK